MEALELQGAEVLPAETGADLVIKIQEEGPFDLVLTDVSLPWVDGLLVMRAARRAGLDAPIIVMTGQTDVRIPPEVGELGRRVALLRKPFNLEELEFLVSRLLEDSPPEHAAP